MSCKSSFSVRMSAFLFGMLGFLVVVQGVGFGYRSLYTTKASAASSIQGTIPDLLQTEQVHTPDEPIDDGPLSLNREDAPAQDSPRDLFLLAFEQVWKTIDSKHWENNPNGLDWKRIREEFEPRIATASDAAQADQILNEMLGRLKQSHFGIIPASQYEPLGSNEDRSGSIGVSLRMVDQKPTVWRVNPTSPAGMKEVKQGWVLLNINGKPIIDQLNKIDELDSPAYSPTLLKQLVLNSVEKGDIGKSSLFVWSDANGVETETELVFSQPAGKRAVLGNLPPFFVECNTRVVDSEIAYFQLSSFFDPPSVIPQLSQLLSEQSNAPGLIVDLRGNPGGIAFMASSLGGFLVREEGVYLGTMNTRDTALRFTLIPRAQTFQGKVAVLVDELSMSTSEILAGGLQDIGRARVFGRPSAGMALPSIVEKLAYGSGFQYAFASYTSAGGKSLESNGVVPNEIIELDSKSLLEGRDLDVEAAIRWIRSDKPVR